MSRQDNTELFRQHMSHHNIICNDEIINDGAIHRFSSDSKNDKECWYAFHGHLGFFESYRLGTGMLRWYFGIDGKSSNRKYNAVKQSIQLHKDQHLKNLKAEHDEAATKAFQLFEDAKTTGSSPYLQKKNVKAYDVRFNDGTLLIPLRDIFSKLWSIQFITESEKRFMTGGKKQGNFHMIGNFENTEEIFVCEGYATGSSIFEATNIPTVVAFDAGNLDPVVASIRSRYPDIKITIAADNDQWKQKNTGKEKAEDVASKRGCCVVLPEFKIIETNPTDFNDLHCLEGLDAVKHQLFDGNKTTYSAVPTGFIMDEDCLYYCNKEDERIAICSPLIVKAHVRDFNGKNWGKLLQWKDSDGRQHDWIVQMELFGGDRKDIKSHLLSHGLTIHSTSATSLLIEYILRSKPRKAVLCPHTRGWHAIENTMFWIGANKIIPPTDQIIMPAETNKCHICTLKEWQDNVANYCRYNDKLIFALCTAFAAPLLHLLNMSSIGFNLLGNSSIGKTTALKVAASVYGKPDEYMVSWRSTSNALENIAASHNHALLCIDEMSQIKADDAKDVAYMLANEKGKNRQKSDSSMRDTLNWRLVFLSTGEISIGDKIAESGQRNTAGVDVRVVDIRAEAQHGIFDTLHDCKDGQALSVLLTNNCSRYYGVAIDKYIECLSNELNDDKILKVLQSLIQKFSTDNLATNATGQIARVTKYFGLLASAGELAIEFGVLPFELYEATKAMTTCYQEWLQNKGNITEPAEIVNGIKQIKYFIETNQNSRFIDKRGNCEDNKTLHNVVGFKTEAVFYIYTQAFKKDVCHGFDCKAILAALKKRELLIVDGDSGYTKNVRIPPSNKQQKVHCISNAILELED